jgi:AraC-like DNA-binding protein
MKAAPDTPQVSVTPFDSFQPEMLEDAVKDARFDHIQLAKGRLCGSLLHARLPDTAFDWGAYNLPLLARGAMLSDRVVLAFILRTGDTGRLNGHPLLYPSAVVLPEGSEVHYRLAPDSEWSTFNVHQEELESVGIHSSPGRVELPRLDAEARWRLHAAITGAVALLHQLARGDSAILDGAVAGRCIREDLLAAYAATLDLTPGPRGCNRSSVEWRLRLLRRAVDFMDAEFAHPLRVARICSTVGTSMKSIERLFLDVHGVTPKRYLTLLRLAKARKFLLSGDRNSVSVAAVATACGFFHLGRFATEYRAIYGENPAWTLAQASPR